MSEIQAKVNSTISRKKRVAATPAEDSRLTLLKQIAEALSTATRGDTEIIIHDLRTPERSIVKIVNGHISGRHVGQPIIAGLFGDQAFDAAIKEVSGGEPNSIRLVKGYKSRTRDGRILDSSSVVLFDDDAVAVAAFCVNHDPSPVDMIERALESLAPGTGRSAAKADTSDDATVEELVSEIIDSALQPFNAPVARLSKQEKVAAVATMHERGLFMLRGSAELVAKRLGATKFTIYNYLEEIGQSRRGADR